ncbi:MAG: sugar phosphate nucleotidyltransferase, partial [Clostridia bacterium]|nr:sugar phosphate nucleotidyltransferase [Clostridia bacterium]
HMLPDGLSHDIVVMNGDILTKVDFKKMLQFHANCDAAATMAVKDYVLEIPYGVVNVDESGVIKSFREKPSHRFFVNAGIYVLSSKIIKHIPNGEFYDMPTLFQELMDKNQTVSAFPIREYWLDIGLPKDYEQANIEFDKQFTDSGSQQRGSH